MVCNELLDLYKWVSNFPVHTKMYLSYELLAYALTSLRIGPNKNISVCQVTGPKVLRRVGTHIFLILFFLKKKIILCILKGISPFKMHNLFFPETLKKIYVSPVN